MYLLDRIKETKEYAMRNYFNLRGKKTNRRIVVIESDDWGSIRTSSKNAFEYFKKMGLPVDKCIYNSNDCLESNTDLECLYEVLGSVKDKNANPAIVTANAIVANPDFKRIRESDFTDYFYEPFVETLKYYPQHNKVIQLYGEGMKSKLIRPQFHGREHVNVARWMNDLKLKNKYTLEAFNQNMFSLHTGVKSEYRGEYMDSLGTDEYGKVVDHSDKIISGIKLFEEIFGYRPTSFIAPCYKWREELNITLKSCGIQYIQGSRVQINPVSELKKTYEKIYHFTGQKNDLNQMFLVRNAYFEVVERPDKDWVDSCLNEIKQAFMFNQPAIISSHRVNYIGSINEKNRKNSLCQLKKLLQQIVKKWPDVEFSPSDQVYKISK